MSTTYTQVQLIEKQQGIVFTEPSHYLDPNSGILAILQTRQAKPPVYHSCKKSTYFL